MKESSAIILDTPEAIRWYHMRAQLGAAKLELLGMKHSSGRSVIKHIKDTYGLKGSKQSVYDQFKEMVEVL